LFYLHKQENARNDLKKLLNHVSVGDHEADPLEGSHGIIIREGNVQEAILIFVLVVNLRNEGCRLGKRVFLDVKEDSLLRLQVNVLPYFGSQMGNRNVVGSQKLSLAYIRECASSVALNNHRDSVWMSGPYLSGKFNSPFKRGFLLKRTALGSSASQGH
jgi:hypothetical protein